MQRVFLVPHNPCWSDDFARESSLVASTLGDLLVAIHHIGSTAIPGIRAKPIIDILAVVSDISLLDDKTPQLEALGYEAKGEFGIPGRRYFRKDDQKGNRTHQIHAFGTGSPQIERHVAFRDFMIAHRHYAKQYEALKNQLAESHPSDISSYSDGKDEFMKNIDARAAAWRSELNSGAFQERVARASREHVEIAPYDPKWPDLFREEQDHLRACLPVELLGRIEHFGSTAVPGLAAKPIVDMLVEVTDLQAAQARIVPILQEQGYDYFWRPTTGPGDGLPWYAWLIKRNSSGVRTHHLHMVEPDFSHWERLLFRDYLIANSNFAQDYVRLKLRLAADHPDDREAYTNGKTEFIDGIMARALAQSPRGDYRLSPSSS